jgi:hypothetical protein
MRHDYVPPVIGRGTIVRSRIAIFASVAAALAAAVVVLPRGTSPPEAFDGTSGPLRPAIFVVACDFTHRAPDDPIVAPGTVAGSHLHDFFGNFTVDTGSTTASLLAGGTRCNRTTDRSGYWVPTMLRDGKQVTPLRSSVYYFAGRKPASTVEPPPLGLKVVAGGVAAPEAVSWNCSNDDTLSPAMRDCGAGTVKLHLRFPDCWDGATLDAPDHRAHLIYADGGCPGSHPVPIPVVRMNIAYPVRGPDGVTLSSGGLETMHGDFFNAWNVGALADLVARCINERTC